MKTFLILGVAAAALLCPGLAAAQDKGRDSRGELLYATHCVACHTAQMHWRAKKIAIDMTSLQEQVRRWQGNAGQRWSEGDIREVGDYLNRLYYKFPVNSGKG